MANQKTLRLELASALIIQNQLHGLTEDMVLHYPSDSAKALQPQVYAASGQALTAMLQAESKEDFLNQRKRLDNLLGQLQTKLAIHGDLDKALSDFRFYQRLQTVLHDSGFEKPMPQWMNDHPEADEWQERLVKLQEQKNKEDFEASRHSLMAELLIKQEEGNLANLASFALIKQNMHTLSSTRLSYLPEVNNTKKVFADLAWILVGGLLVSAAAVLGLVFPVLIIPGIVVGAIALGYGVIDFAKENVELIAEAEELEELRPGQATMKELEQLEQQFPGFSKENFLEQQEAKASHQSSEKKLLQGLGYTIAFAGMALGVAGLLAVIPGVGIPIAGLIAITVLAATVTLLATALWGYKLMNEQEKLILGAKEVKEQIAADEALIAEADLGLHKGDELSSSAKIFLRELRATKHSVASLEIGAEKAWDDEVEEVAKEPSPVVTKEKEVHKEDDEGDSEGESPSKVVH